MTTVTVTDYRILTHENVQNLEREVRSLLTQNWRPTGAVSPVMGGSVMQAMIKYQVVDQAPIAVQNQQIENKQEELIGEIIEPMMSLYFRRIKDCNLRVRPVNRLTENGIYLVGDLVQKSEEQLMKIRELGRGTFNEIMEELDRLGLQLKTKFTENQLMQLEQYKNKNGIGIKNASN